VLENDHLLVCGLEELKSVVRCCLLPSVFLAIAPYFPLVSPPRDGEPEEKKTTSVANWSPPEIFVDTACLPLVTVARNKVILNPFSLI